MKTLRKLTVIALCMVSAMLFAVQEPTAASKPIWYAVSKLDQTTSPDLDHRGIGCLPPFPGFARDHRADPGGAHAQCDFDLA